MCDCDSFVYMVNEMFMQLNVILYVKRSTYSITKDAKMYFFLLSIHPWFIRVQK